mgnify:FL=1
MHAPADACANSRILSKYTRKHKHSKLNTDPQWAAAIEINNTPVKHNRTKKRTFGKQKELNGTATGPGEAGTVRAVAL